MDKKPEIILIDGTSFIYRAYYAAKKGFATKSGIPTGAVYIFTRMLRLLLNAERKRKYIMVFDHRGNNFRHELYPAYKENRIKMPDDLKLQVPIIHHVSAAMGLPVISLPGVEADDVLGSYAAAAVKEGYKVVICTGDKDLAQLVNDDITLLDTMKDTVYDKEGVIKKFGVPPSRIIDLLALKGDSADNIPGMKGVGDVTASMLLQNIGGIEDIKNNLDKVSALSFRGSGTFAKRFTEQLPTIELSYKLATIVTDIKLPIVLHDIHEPYEDHKRLIRIFKALEFARFATEQEEMIGQNIVGSYENTTFESHFIGFTPDSIDFLFENLQESDLSSANRQDPDLPLFSNLTVAGNNGIKDKSSKTNSPTADETTPDTTVQKNESAESDLLNRNSFAEKLQRLQVITNTDIAQSFINRVREDGLFAFYVFPEDDRTKGRVPGISFSLKDGECAYLPLNHIFQSDGLKDADRESFLKDMFESEDIIKTAHDLKSQRLILHFAGTEIKGPMIDTMLLCHMSDPGQSNKLDVLAIRYLKYTATTFDSEFDKKADMAEMPVSMAASRGCEQSLMTVKLYEKALHEVKEIYKEQTDAFLKCEADCLDTLYLMEKRGAFVNTKKLAELSGQYKKMQEESYEEIKTYLGDCRITSPRQLGRKLFDELAIPYPGTDKKTDSQGNRIYSTAEDILSQVADQHPVIPLLLRFRFLSKIISTYTDKLPQLVSPRTKRVHTNFNLAGTVTGRLSSSEPNLQNIPARTQEGKLIRNSFTAPEGYLIISADYSQIELRLLAHFSQDPNLIKAFIHDEDIHRATAAEVLGKDISEVTDEERSSAKSTNFGLMYGMSSYGLAKRTGMSKQEAAEYIETYFKRYPKILNYMEQVKTEAVTDGYIKSLTGRHITIKDIKCSGSKLKAAERAAINAPMQSSAADIIKMAMLAAQKYINTLPEGSAYMTLQVHDELVFEVRESLAEEFSRKLKELMENVYTLSVPLKVGVSSAANWGSAH